MHVNACYKIGLAQTQIFNFRFLILIRPVFLMFVVLIEHFLQHVFSIKTKELFRKIAHLGAMDFCADISQHKLIRLEKFRRVGVTLTDLFRFYQR